MARSSCRISFVFLVLSILSLTGVWAQKGTAQLEGVVRDNTGGVIPGVSIVVLNTGTGIARETLSNDAGNYVFPALPAGLYTLTAEIDGFRKAVVNNLKLDVAATVAQDLTLEVGDIADEVTVTAASVGLVQTTTADVADTVNETTVKTLPLNGRNPLELVQLQAGVAGVQLQSEQGSASDQGTNYAGLGVNGARAVNNAVYLDGVDITNSEFGTGAGINIGTDITQSVDAIEEFRVISLNPTAEFGKNSGMQIEIVTKSGTNEFHGSLYAFHRNDVVNANRFFNNMLGLERPKLLRNQFGGSIGGPVRVPGYDGRNKTFFFFSWEGFRERAGSSVERTVLTQEARNGVFRYYLDGPNSTTLVDPNTGQVLSQFNGRIGSFDAAARDICCWEGIGADSSGAVARYIGLTPLPNFFGNPGDSRDGLNFASYRFNANDPENRENWVAKVDHQLTNEHSLSGRLSHGEITRLSDFAPFPGLPGRAREEEQNGISLNWISTWSPTVTNEARVGLSRNTRRFTSSIQNPGEIILDCDSAFDCLGITNPDLTGEESFTARQTLQATDNFSWVRGNHQFKWGYTFRSNPLNVRESSRSINLDFNTEPRNQQGSSVDLAVLVANPIPLSTNDRIPAANFFNFTTGRVGGVIATINALNTEEFGDLSGGRIRGFRQREHSWFIQDTWRATNNLTVNLGLRHEIYGVPFEVNSFYTQPVSRNLIITQLLAPGAGCNSFGVADALNRCEQPDITFGAIGPRTGTRIFEPDYNNFAPVVGLSWDPFGKGKTAIRASYRIAYDKIFTATLNSLDASAPGLSTDSVINGDALRDAGVTNFIAPGGSLAGSPRVPRLSDLQGTSVGGVNLNGSFNLAGFLSTPGVNIPDAPLGRVSKTRTSGGPSQFSPDFQTAYAQSWSLGIQHEVFENTVFEARYVGRKGSQEYLGLPANEFRTTPEFARQIQELQYLLSGGDLGLAPSVLPPGFQVGTPVSISTLFGSSPNTADDYTQWVAGALNDYAFDQFNLLYPFFLAGRNSFDSNISSAILRNDFVSTIAGIDNRTDFHGNDFLTSVPGFAVPSGMGLSPCPEGRDPNRNLFGCLPIIVGIPEDFFRATPQFLNGPRVTSNSAYSNYHAMQLELTRRMSEGLQFQVNYTFAKNLDITSVSQPVGQDIISFLCIRCDYSFSDNDVTHDFKFNWVWEIPVGKGRRFGNSMAGVLDQAIGGWTLAGFVSAATDFPYNIAVNGRDRTAVASTGGIRPSFAAGVGEDDVSDIGSVQRRGNGVFYFDPAQFDGLLTRTLIGNLGNVPRNLFRGPGWFNADLVVMKTFDLSPIGESWRLDFRAEFFNAFNRANFANPSLNADRGPYVDLSSGDAGRIISTLGNPRLVQFALKLRF